MYIKNSAGGKKKILLKEEFIAMIKEFEKQIKIDHHFLTSFTSHHSPHIIHFTSFTSHHSPLK